MGFSHLRCFCGLFFLTWRFCFREQCPGLRSLSAQALFLENQIVLLLMYLCSGCEVWNAEDSGAYPWSLLWCLLGALYSLSKAYPEATLWVGLTDEMYEASVCCFKVGLIEGYHRSPKVSSCDITAKSRSFLFLILLLSLTSVLSVTAFAQAKVDLPSGNHCLRVRPQFVLFGHLLHGNLRLFLFFSNQKRVRQFKSMVVIPVQQWVVQLEFNISFSVSELFSMFCHIFYDLWSGCSIQHGQWCWDSIHRNCVFMRPAPNICSIKSTDGSPHITMWPNISRL